MKEILCKIIGINEIKKNKLYFALKMFFSLFFAITIFLDSILVFKGSIFGSIDEIYFKKIDIVNILIFIGVWIATYVMISIIEILSDKLECTIYTKKPRKTKNIKVYFIILFVILLCWLPTILSFFPGGIYSDTVKSIRQAIRIDPISNYNPILYALIIRVCLLLTNSLQSGIELFTIFQILLMASIISYSIYWLYKRNISIKYIVLVTMFFGLFNLIPIYAISLWKDTLFCIALYAFIIYIAQIVYQDAKGLEKFIGMFLYIILMLLVCFLRNNGIYIATATTIIVLLVYRKRIFKELKMFTVFSLISLLMTYIIQGPIYNHLHLNTEFVENLGVPVQQLCYVVVEDGNLQEHQKNFINAMCPVDKIKEIYNPCIVDKVKGDPSFNNAYLSENKLQFFKVWGTVFLQNPVSYAKAYLLNTIGFWDVNKATFDAYTCPQMWGEKEQIEISENNSIKQMDYIETITNHSIRGMLMQKKPISSAVFLFIILLGTLVTIYKKKYKNLLIYLPSILTWATIMIAAPLAFSLRYVYILVLVTPMAFLIPFLNQKDLTENKEKEVKKYGKKE